MLDTSRLVARAVPNSGRGEYDLGRAVKALGGGGIGRGGDRVPKRHVPPLLTQLGIAFAEIRVSTLIGMARGERRDFGQLIHEGHPVLWDIWVPHLGMAFDVVTREAAEIDAKHAWAADRRIIYSDPASTSDVETLRQLVAERQAVTQIHEMA